MTKEQSKQEIKRFHDAFIQSVQQDIGARRYPRDPGAYREFYLEHLQKTDPALHGHLRNVQYRKGDPRFLGDVDHIIPQSIWTLLTGFEPTYVNVVSNLWIRDAHTNRSYDQYMINLIRKEQAENRLDAAKKQQWIGLFLGLKDRDVEGYPWAPKSFSRLSRWEAEQMVGDLDGKPAR